VRRREGNMRIPTGERAAHLVAAIFEQTARDARALKSRGLIKGGELAERDSRRYPGQMTAPDARSALDGIRDSGPGTMESIMLCLGVDPDLIGRLRREIFEGEEE
jgi:hypothetical protein